MGRKKKSNFKNKMKFGKRGSQTQNSVEVQNTKVYRQSAPLKIVLLNKFFARSREIFNVQPVYKLFAKHGVLRYSFVKKLFAYYLFCELVL